MQTLQPYLSVVVTARNDDHGGNLLGRVQIFVSGWIAQARRYNLPSELIIVEWNPPADRPRLQEVLGWPEEFGPCDVRFLEVPRELHLRYQHAEALPLYQMIAKNAGIRRARGRFILATNIDILFSDELMAFLAGQRLETDRMYRIDRHDAMSDVPISAGIDKQLEYCRNHLLRINAREGTFPLTPDGRRDLAREDIAVPESGLRFGSGWFPPERHPDGEAFRWVDIDSTIHLHLPAVERVLRLELEPGPAMGLQPMELAVFTGGEAVLEATIDRRSLLRVPLPPLASDRCDLRIQATGGRNAVAHDPRILAFRVFSCIWEGQATQTTAVTRAPVGFRRRAMQFWNRLQELIHRLSTSNSYMTVTVPVARPIRQAAGFYVRSGGFTGMALRLLGRPPRRAPRKPAAVSPAPDKIAFLHTNACGDFTMAARERWLDLRAYPEFDMYSMNIDSVFCYAAHHGGAAEEILPEPMRIYHIEHGIGSGWTPEGQAQLFARMAAKGIPFVSYQDLVGWAAQMRQMDCPMIFNHDNWGLADFVLKETRPRSSGQIPRSLQPSVRRAGDSE
jgi:hypothetical protein